MKGYIYEMPVYDGALKEWRILNLNSGTFYGTRYGSEKQAERNIEEGELRGGKIVKKVSRTEIIKMLNDKGDSDPKGYCAMTTISNYPVRFWEEEGKYYNRIQRRLDHGGGWTPPSSWFTSLEAARENARADIQYWQEEDDELYK